MRTFSTLILLTSGISLWAAPTAELYPADINHTEGPNVLINTDLEMVFSETITAGAGVIELRLGSDDSLVESFTANSSGQVTVSGTDATINPTSILTYNTDYYLLVAATAFTGTSGDYAGVSDTLTWEFTTQAQPELVAHLPLNGDLKDISTVGVNHDGTAIGNPTFVEDRFGLRQALLLDGINDYVQLANSDTDLHVSHFYIAPYFYSFNIWFKASVGEANGVMVAKSSTGIGTESEYMLNIKDSNGKLTGTCQWRTVTSTARVDDNQWHMGTWVAYYDNKLRANRWAIYLDGVYQGTTGDVAGNALGIDVLLGARRDNNNETTTAFLDGAIDDFRFYNNSLTSDQILEIYQKTDAPAGTIISIK